MPEPVFDAVPLGPDAASSAGADARPPRPPVILRFFSGVAVILLALNVLFPLAGLASVVAMLVLAPVNGLAPGSVERDHLIGAGVVAGAFALFVGAAVLLARIINFLSSDPRRRRRPLAWGLVAWLLAAPGAVVFSAAFGGPHGGELGIVLWGSLLVLLVSLFLARRTARGLWRWGGRSTFGAATNAIAAILLVLIPNGLALAMPAILEEARAAAPESLTNPEAPFFFGTSSSPRKRVGGGTASAAAGEIVNALALGGGDDGESDVKLCYDELVGPACNDVWTRARNTIVNLTPDPDDALQSAFLDVCAENRLRAERSCGRFFNKAKQLAVNSYRYSRRFRDDPDAEEPACPLPTADDALMSQEELNLLDRALAQLDERSRRILDLAYRQNLVDRVIAQKLGLSEDRVGKLRRAAERALKEKLEECR